MSSLDFLYIVIALGFIVFVACIAYLTYLFSNTLKSLQRVIDKVEDTASDISMVREGIKYGAISLFSTLLSKVGRGGGKNEKQ